MVKDMPAPDREAAHCVITDTRFGMVVLCVSCAGHPVTTTNHFWK